MENKKQIDINDLIRGVKAPVDGYVLMNVPETGGKPSPKKQDYQLSDLVNNKEAARILGVTENTLAVWRSAKRYGLRFYKIGGRVRYRVSDLLSWLETRSCCDGEPT